MGLSKSSQQTPNIESARLTRAKLNGKDLARSIKNVSILDQGVRDVRSESNPAEKMFEDGFEESKLTNTELAKQDQVKKDLEEATKNGDKIKAYAQEQYKTASKYAQSLAAQLIISLEPDALKFLRKKDESGKLAELNPEEFEAKIDKLLEDPDQIPYIMKDLLSNDLKAKFKEFENDPDKLNELNEHEAKLAPIFFALKALENDSHVEMFDVIGNIDNNDIEAIGGKRLRNLIKDYTESLADIGRRQKHQIGITLQNENTFLKVAKEVNPKVDKQEYRNFYARVGGVVATRNGGISGAGSVFNFKEGDIAHGMDPFEYKDGSTDLEVRRLVSAILQPAQYRHYVGVALGEDKVNSKGEITEERSRPKYVLLDTDIALQEPPKFDVMNGDIPGGGQTMNG